jgi:hypothetical protein
LFAQDPFAFANLDAQVNGTGLEVIPGVLLLVTFGIGHVLYERRSFRASLIVVFAGSALFVTTTLFFFINNIEAYSQRAAVEFFESKAGERCWLMTKGYKSYVPEFYGRAVEAAPSEDVLLRGPIDRTVYLSCKITDVKDVRSLETFTEIGNRNGFVFFKRTP